MRLWISKNWEFVAKNFVYAVGVNQLLMIGDPSSIGYHIFGGITPLWFELSLYSWIENEMIICLICYTCNRLSSKDVTILSIGTFIIFLYKSAARARSSAGMSAAFARQRPRVQIPPSPLVLSQLNYVQLRFSRKIFIGWFGEREDSIEYKNKLQLVIIKILRY